jgi:hypothetical protein
LALGVVPGFLLTFANAFGLALAPRAARAEEAAHAKDDATRHAKELFEQGTTLFNLGQFDKAIEAWQEGYKAKPDPGFLYNIGQAYRLKGDPAKAIFFYRGYLRTSPKAPNRADVETKIAALQKEVQKEGQLNDAKPVGTPPPVAPPPAVAAPASPPAMRPPVVAAPPPGPPPVAPPPATAPPLAGTAPGAAPAPMSEEPPAPLENRPTDLHAEVGFAKWSSGFKIGNGVPAQLVWSVGGGYTFGDVFGAVSFRVGGLIARTTLEENLPRTSGTGTMANTLSFTSFLVEPSLRVRLVERRFFVAASLGIGGTSIGGVQTNSVVIDPAAAMMGTIQVKGGNPGAFTLRPALALQLHLTPGLVATATPAFSLSPKPTNFYQALNRFELLFGLAYLF